MVNTNYYLPEQTIPIFIETMYHSNIFIQKIKIEAILYRISFK